GVLGYSGGDDSLGFSVKFIGYHGMWNSTDQIARRTLERPGFDRFDTLNPTDAGDSQRYALIGEWHRANAISASSVTAFSSYYDMHLWSDFTYFLASPQGDQFEQLDRRWLGGVDARHTWFSEFSERDMENTVGLQFRTDDVDNGLYQTVSRTRTDKVDHDGNPIPATTRTDGVWQTSVSP